MDHDRLALVCIQTVPAIATESTQHYAHAHKEDSHAVLTALADRGRACGLHSLSPDSTRRQRKLLWAALTEPQHLLRHPIASHAGG